MKGHVNLYNKAILTDLLKVFSILIYIISDNVLIDTAALFK